MGKYRYLEKGEIVKPGDEFDGCADGWRDDADWKPVNENSIGRAASDPAYPSHTKFRRKLSWWGLFVRWWKSYRLGPEYAESKWGNQHLRIYTQINSRFGWPKMVMVCDGDDERGYESKSAATAVLRLLGKERELNESLRAQIAERDAEIERLKGVITEARNLAHDCPEINPSNYDHEQVCELNAQSTGLYLFLDKEAQALNPNEVGK